MITVRIEGLDDLRKALLGIPEELRAKYLRRAVAAAARVVRDDARSRVPVLKKPDKRRKPGTLRNAIRVGFSKLDSSNVQTTFNVFVKELSSGAILKFYQATRKSGSQNPDDPFYWKVWEFGNGINASHPFLRPAMDSKWREAAERMKASLLIAVEKAAAVFRW